MNLDLRASLLVVVAAGCFCGCGPEEADAPGDSVASRAAPLVGVPSLYWPASWHYEAPSWIQGPTFVDVCFLAGTQAQRAQVQNRVERTWQRATRVTFRGWQTCTSSQVGIRIDFRTAPGLGSRSVFGIQALNPGTTMILDPFDTQNSTSRFELVITHEFGHALAYNHAECRSDYNSSGDKNLNGIADSVETNPLNPAEFPCAPVPSCTNTRTYGSYDVNSVMSACGRYSVSLPTFRVGLSPNDVAAVQTAYGRKIAGQLVTPRGKCLTMPAATQGFIYDCDEENNRQELRLQIANETLDIGGACLESAPIGSPSVFMYPVCDGYAGQKWRFESVSIAGWGGLCLDLENGNTNNGRVQLFECGAAGGVNQKWTPVPSGEIRFGASSATSCLAAVSGVLRVQPCNGTLAQRFDLTATGQIRLRSSGLCVDAQGPLSTTYSPATGNGGGLPVNRTSVNEFTCLSTQLNQKFNLTGPVRHLASSTCLERVADGNTNGTFVQRAACNGSEAQVWDYFPL